MSESEDPTFDTLDLTVGRAIDEAAASIEAGEIDLALAALERALEVSEAHPLLSKRASSEFHRVEGMARICGRALEAANAPAVGANALIDRARALRKSRIH